MKYQVKVLKTTETVIEVAARSRREAISRALKEAAHGSVVWERQHYKPIILHTRKGCGKR